MPDPSMLFNPNFKLEVESPDGTKTKGYAIGNDGNLVGFLPKSFVEGLSISPNSATPASKVDILSGKCCNDTGSNDILISATKTIDMAVSGLNGLDTGTETADTWYAIHLIGDSAGVNPSGGIFSLSATAPTLPSGYDVFRRIGWAHNDASSNFLKFTQSGKGSNRTVWYDMKRADVRILNGGTATSFTSVDCSAFVPSTATDIKILAHFKTGASGAIGDMMEFRLPGSTVTNPLFSFRAPVVSNTTHRTQFQIMLSDTQTTEYAVSDAANNSATLHIVSYLDEL